MRWLFVALALVACGGPKTPANNPTNTKPTTSATSSAQTVPTAEPKLVFTAAPSKPIVETPPLNLPANPSSTVANKLHYNRPATDPYAFVCPPKKPEDGTKCLRATAAKDGGCNYADAACGCEHGPPADAEIEGKWKCTPKQP
jgi:hypothetical protein